MPPQTPGQSPTPQGPQGLDVEGLAQKYGLDPGIIHRQIQQESGWNQSAVSPKGAVGLMQLMPQTSERLGVDATDPKQNLEGGMREMGRLVKKYGGDYSKALAAYNAGESTVDALGGKIPNYPETQGYVKAILGDRSATTPSRHENPQWILDAVQVPKGVKAEAWDAYHAATDAKDFQSRFDKLDIPKDSKAQLWDMKFGDPRHPRVTQPEPQTSPLFTAAGWKKALMGPGTAMGMLLGEGPQEAGKLSQASQQAGEDKSIGGQFVQAGVGEAAGYMGAHEIGSQPIAKLTALQPEGTAPVWRGIARGGESLTTPESIALMKTGGVFQASGEIGVWANRVFAAQMAKGNYDQAKEFVAAVKNKDWDSAMSTAGEFAVSAPFTVAAAHGSKLTREENASIRKHTGMEAKPAPAPQVSQTNVTEVQATRPPTESKVPYRGQQTPGNGALASGGYRMNAMGYAVLGEAPAPAASPMPQPVTPAKPVVAPEVKPQVEAAHQVMAAKTEAQPNPAREVMRQPASTSRGTPTGEARLFEGRAGQLPAELHADLEKQAGRKLSNEEAVAADRANLERGMASGIGQADASTAIREQKRAELEKPDPTRYAPKTPTTQNLPVDPATRLKEIDARLEAGARGTKTPEEKVAWAQTRSDLMKEAKALHPVKTTENTPINQIAMEVVRTVTPDRNPNSPSRESREGDLKALIDHHAATEAIGPEHLRSAAAQMSERGDLIDYHLDVQEAKRKLQAARKESGVERIRTQGYAEPGEAAPGEGERTKAGVQFVDKATTARRTVLDMLGGYHLTAKRLYEPETGKVERDFRKQPLTPEESDFVRAQQAQLGEKVNRAIASKSMPSEAELADMEKHVTAIEAGTGMKMVYSGKGSAMSGFDPGRDALNELLGRGRASHLAVNKSFTREGIAGQRVDRLEDAAMLLRQHADRLEGREAPMAPAVTPPSEEEYRQAAKGAGIEYRGLQRGIPGKITDLAMFQDPQSGTSIAVEPQNYSREELGKRLEAARVRMTGTPRLETSVVTPEPPASPKAADRMGEIDVELNELRDNFRDAQATEKAGGQPVSKEMAQETIRRVKELQAEKNSLRRPEGGFLNIRTGSPEDITSLRGKIQDLQDKLGLALQSISGHVLDMVTDYREQRPWGAPEEVMGQFKLKKRMVDQFRQGFDEGLKKLIPDASRRIAITNYLQAGGDQAVLATREAASGDRFKAGYRNAQNLTPLETVAAESIRQSYDELWDRANQAGVLHTFLGDYVNQLYKGKKTPMGIQSVINDIGNGKLKQTPGLARQRFYQSYFDAEQAGLIPRNKDIGFLHSTYIDQLEKSIRSRTFVRAGQDALATDGRPMFAPEGVGRLIRPEEADPTVFVKPHAMRDVNLGTPQKPDYVDTHDYKTVQNSNMRSWQWSAKDPESGLNVFMEGDLRVHPDYVGEAKSMLETSALRQSPTGRAALSLAAGFKHIMFAATPFHPAQLTLHAMEHGVNPFRLIEPDVLNSSDQQLLAAGGLQTHDYDARETFGKGIEGQQLINSIPGLGQFNRWYSHWLFQEYLPKLKTTMAVEALGRNRTRYSGKMTDGQIASLTADQANAAFGGLDYEKLGRSKTLQDFLKIGFIAPDFFEARARFVGQSMKPGGKEQATALLRGAAVMYGAARIANQVLDGDAHWDRPFDIVAGGREYTYRSVQSDLWHAVSDFKGFMYNRLNPVLVKPAIEALTGRDQQGFERGPSAQVRDFFTGVSPVGFQRAFKDPTISGWESFVSGFGLSSHAYHTKAEQTALSFMMADLPRGEKGAEEEARLQALSSIRRAAQRGSDKEVSQALDHALDKGLISDADADALYKNAGGEYLPQLVKRLSAENAMEVFRRANPAERDMIEDMVHEKVDAALASKSPAIQKRIEKESNELFEKSAKP